MPNDGRIWNNLGSSYRDIKDNKKSIEAYMEAIELNTKNDLFLRNLADTYCDIEEYDKSIVAIQRAIEINPANEKNWEKLGYLYSKTNLYDKAIEANLKAIMISPNDEGIWNNIAILYNDIKQYEKAIEAFLKVIEINPQYQKAWYNLGVLYGLTKQYDKAIESNIKGLEIMDSDEDIWNNLGVLYSNNKQYDEAYKSYKQALKINKRNPSIWNNLGIDYFQQGRLIDAEKSLNKAIRYSNEDDYENITVRYCNLIEVQIALQKINEVLSSIELLFSKPYRLDFIIEMEDAVLLLLKENSENKIKKVFNKLLQICEAYSKSEKLSVLLSNVVFRVLREYQEIKPLRMEMLQHILEELFSGKPEFTYPLRFLNIGFRYFMKGEKEAIYEMSQEERVIFEKFTSTETNNQKEKLNIKISSQEALKSF